MIVSSAFFGLVCRNNLWRKLETGRHTKIDKNHREVLGGGDIGVEADRQRLLFWPPPLRVPDAKINRCALFSCLIRWATFRLQKVKKQRKDEKLSKARKAKMRKRQNTETLKSPTPSVGVFWVIFYCKTGKIEILTFFWPTGWGYGQ